MPIRVPLWVYVVEREVRFRISESIEVRVGVGTQHDEHHLDRRPRNHSEMPLVRCKCATDTADSSPGTPWAPAGSTRDRIR